jgi:acetyl esterase
VYASARVVYWVMSEDGREAGFDGGKVMLAGDSAGGGMAAAVTSVLINTSPEKAKYIVANVRFTNPCVGYGVECPQVFLQVLFYPYLDLTQSHASNFLFAEGFFLTAEHLLWYGQQYVRNQSDYLHPLASPLFGADSTLRAMPPTLILTAEKDPLRDEGEEFGHKLSALGVVTKTIRFNATVHAYMFLPCHAQRASVQEMKSWISTHAFHGREEQPAYTDAESASTEL